MTLPLRVSGKQHCANLDSYGTAIMDPRIYAIGYTRSCVTARSSVYLNNETSHKRIKYSGLSVVRL